MCYHHRRFGVTLIALGVLIGTIGIVHHGRAASERDAFERHVAEICVKAAERVHQ
ncbi:MAG TPA: hypothetical protein VIV60_20230 [Polyangiaceae bacterium]